MAAKRNEIVKLLLLVLASAAVVYFAVTAKQIITDNEFNKVYDRAHKINIFSSGQEQEKLAMLYEQGIFTEQNKDKAIYWYEMAASRGSDFAKKHLCEKYNVNCEDKYAIN